MLLFFNLFLTFNTSALAIISPIKKKSLLEVFANLEDIDEEFPNVDENYAEIRTYLESQGTPIGGNDLLIAAHAISLNLIVITNNVREFSRVPNLQVENWLKTN
jgi:tRNA(fMet)-specific endonuclease VapC